MRVLIIENVALDNRMLVQPAFADIGQLTSEISLEWICETLLNGKV